MLSDDELKAAAKTALRLAIESARDRSPANVLTNLGVTAATLQNLGVTAAASSPKPLVVPQELPLPRTDQADRLTRAEIADYLDRAGWDPDKAQKLAAAELAVDFGHSLTSKHLQVFANLIDEAPEQDQTALQLQTVDLLGRWLLRKRQAVGPDGRIVVGVRSLRQAKKIVAVWISDDLFGLTKAPHANDDPAIRTHRLSFAKEPPAQ